MAISRNPSQLLLEQQGFLAASESLVRTKRRALRTRLLVAIVSIFALLAAAIGSAI